MLAVVGLGLAGSFAHAVGTCQAAVLLRVVAWRPISGQALLDLRREGDQNGELRSFFPGFALLGWLSFFCFGGCLGGDFPLGSFLSALFFFVYFLEKFEIKIDRKCKHRFNPLESSSIITRAANAVYAQPI
jgi:hypothetical protein